MRRRRMGPTVSVAIGRLRPLIFFPFHAWMPTGIWGLNRVCIRQDLGRRLVLALLLTGRRIQHVRSWFPYPLLIPAAVGVLDGIPRGTSSGTIRHAIPPLTP